MLVANPVVYDGRVLRHAQTLAEAGHAVTVLGVIGPGDRDDAIPDELAAVTVRRLDRRKRGLVPRSYWLSSALRQRTASHLFGLLPAPLGARLPQAAALSVATSGPELAAAAAWLGGDVYHANDLNTLPAAAWAAALTGGRYVYDSHEVYVDEAPDLTETERRARATTEGHYARGAAAVLTVSTLIANDLAARYGLPTPRVVRNLSRRVAVTPPGERPPPPPGRLRLLYHGAHVGLDQAGTDDLLRALARLQTEPELDVTLTIRGGLRPEARAAMERRLAELHLAGRVRLAPKVKGAEALVRAACDEGADLGLAVHPPLCLSYTYTTSSKIYEYQAAGLAVCATDLIGNREAVGPGAGVFYRTRAAGPDHGDDAELAALLAALARDPARLLAMKQAAYDHAQRELSWESERRQLLSIYEELP